MATGVSRFPPPPRLERLTMARTLLHDHGNRIHANHGEGKACPCCCRWATERDRQRERQQARRIERREWRKEILSSALQD